MQCSSLNMLLRQFRNPYAARYFCKDLFLHVLCQWSVRIVAYNLIGAVDVLPKYI